MADDNGRLADLAEDRGDVFGLARHGMRRLRLARTAIDATLDAEDPVGRREEMTDGVPVRRLTQPAMDDEDGAAFAILGAVDFGAVGGLDEETSTGYELGLRYAGADGVASAEAVGFYTAFDDLIVVSNIGGTGTGTSPTPPPDPEEEPPQ